MIDHPRATVAVMLAALAAVVAFPEQAILIELLLLPFVIGGAVLATWYLWRVYGRNPVGVVWRQIVGAQITSLPFVIWIGYLVIARIGNETGQLRVPVPTAGQSAPVSGLLLILAITPSIRYALTVYRLGRAAAERAGMNDRSVK